MTKAEEQGPQQPGWTMRPQAALQAALDQRDAEIAELRKKLARLEPSPEDAAREKSAWEDLVMERDMAEVAWSDAQKHIAELESGPQAPQWQPIATAPRGTIVLTWAIVDTETGNWNMRTSSRRRDPEPGTDFWDIWPFYCQPTHWMPLPAPPSAQPQPNEGIAFALHESSMGLPPAVTQAAEKFQAAVRHWDDHNSGVGSIIACGRNLLSAIAAHEGEKP